MEERDLRAFAVNEIVNLYPRVNYDEHLDPDDISCVWISSALQHISGLFTSRYNDGLIFHVIHNGDTNQTKIETYRKIADNSYF